MKKYIFKVFLIKVVICSIVAEVDDFPDGDRDGDDVQYVEIPFVEPYANGHMKYVQSQIPAGILPLETIQDHSKPSRRLKAPTFDHTREFINGKLDEDFVSTEFEESFDYKIEPTYGWARDVYNKLNSGTCKCIDKAAYEISNLTFREVWTKLKIGIESVADAIRKGLHSLDNLMIISNETEIGNKKIRKYVASELSFYENNLLAMPDLKVCKERVLNMNRPKEEKILITRESEEYQRNWKIGSKKAFSWIDARNECRQMCMELVTTDTYQRLKEIVSLMYNEKVKALWTSGRLCNSEEVLFEPNNKNNQSWIWVADRKLINFRDHAFDVGYALKYSTKKFNSTTPENCLSLILDSPSGEYRWQKADCEEEKGFVCEYSEPLVRSMENFYSVFIYQ